MKPFFHITRIPYEEPHSLNLLVAASNGHQSSELEIYINAEDLSKAADTLLGFPRHDKEVFLWELGSERHEDRFAFYFRFRVFQVATNGLCAIQLRFNNNEELPQREISEFCLEAYPADLDRLSRLFKQFSRLKHTVLEWTITDGSVMTELDRNDIKRRWPIFCGEPYPDSMAGHEVDGICVTSLDTFAAGCIETFVTNGTLDLHRRDVLESCVKELQVLVPQLAGEPQNYFRELLRLSRAVISCEKIDS